ncbi:dihydrolipoamide acetyltransferase family protein [Nocardia inohanensis]|uniref:dihydrolipoamide acetyltransferase family protein n=1 Tax=Nocardia inohanensis TaxID=209246 RepID=UPI0008378CB4|nr:dihydrolipoamide acetyltransferase family protein [Nocardia inohanensis]
MEFRLPDLGEGLADAELVSWSVAVGDTVELNQIIAEVETAKAQVALPSPYAGTVTELLAEPGETVLVGAPLIRIATTAAAPAAESDATVSGSASGSTHPESTVGSPHPETAVSATSEQAGGRQSVLVGYGPENEGVSRRARAAAARGMATPRERGVARILADAGAPAGAPIGGNGMAAGTSATAEAHAGASTAEREADATGRPAAPADAGGPAGPGAEAGTESGASSRPATGGPNFPARESDSMRAAATPAARRLAREMGVDLGTIPGSGPGGAVRVEDLAGAQPQPRADHIPIHTAPPVTSMSTTGSARANSGERETRTPIAGIRKRTAAAMVASAQHIPQASAFVTTDFTGSMELLDHLRATTSFAGLTLTPLALVAKATLVALSEFPELNAYWDEADQQIVTKHYVNLGIAVATERGLLVPNLKEAQGLSLRDLCVAIGKAAETARAGTATPADLTGGTFTISNVGVFGVDTGVPLVNPGEAGILCLGSIRKRPWVHRDELAVRWVTTLGLSFDHRLIDGEQGARFLANVAALLEDPLTLLGRV